jgi:hypothetical protein
MKRIVIFRQNRICQRPFSVDNDHLGPVTDPMDPLTDLYDLFTDHFDIKKGMLRFIANVTIKKSRLR